MPFCAASSSMLAYAAACHGAGRYRVPTLLSHDSQLANPGPPTPHPQPYGIKALHGMLVTSFLVVSAIFGFVHFARFFYPSS